MVKRQYKSSVSEEGVESQIINENGKRNTEDTEKVEKKKQKTFGLYRQPTAQELNRLQETESLFNSNLFRLQVDEILQEVKVKDKTEKKFTEWFTNFKTYLLAIPEDKNEYDLTEANLFKRLKVKEPVGSELKKTKCMFKFHKFKDVEIVGSYALGCPINSKLKIDLQITVPGDTYTKNDSINYRYHKKRAAYLACIASHIIKSEYVEDVQYSWLHGSEINPVLDLKPTGKLANHVSVRINLTCEAEAYKFHRFSPARNNLRESWLFTKKTENCTDVGPPTPYYNSRVLSDLTAATNQELLKETLAKSENLKQAIILLKIWLHQRNLQVSGYIISLLVVYFVSIKRINNIMSSYQIVRNIWIALKASEWDTKGISLYKGEGAPTLEEFHKHFPVVFIDHTGYYNLCWEMCKGTYDALKSESSLAVEMLDNGKINSFIPLFMTPVKPLLHFDHILRFKNFQSVKNLVLSKVSKEAKVNYGVDQLALFTDTLHALLTKGLGKRVDLILQMVEADFSWPVKKSPEKAKSEGFEEKLSFGLILNSENAMNNVEKGPPANLPEAELFRTFWGEKSELRRFQDGSIMETCVWGGDSSAERRTITKQIVDYLMLHHYGIPPSDLFHISNQLDSLTARKQYSKGGLLYVEESSLEALQAFDSLRRDLRQLTQLPLDVSAVYGVSPVFSYCAPLPPVPLESPRPRLRGSTCLMKTTTNADGTACLPDYMPACEAVIELGHSGKWPGNIEAFRCLKAAFHLQIADRLNKQYSLPTQAYPTHVDVLKNGLVFRLSIAHPKEITLVRKEMENGVAKFKESEESVKLQCDTVLMPRLRGALHGLHTKYPLFGPTVCLFKRWLCSHLLSPPHFPATVAELLCARSFVGAERPPAGAARGLLRVLGGLAYTDWGTENVVLDFHGDMSREEISSVEQQLSSDPLRPALCIATSLDGNLPSVWSRSAPSVNVLNRARTLADSTLKYMQKELDNMNDNLLGAFVPSLSGYDALIHLHPHLVPYIAERIDKKPNLKPLPDKPGEDIIPVVEFNPVTKYLEELRSAYDDYALFFHDQYGGEIIAVLWKPDIRENKEFQLLAANALTPVTVEGETKYKVNIDALLQDFRILGDGLVTSITVN